MPTCTLSHQKSITRIDNTLGYFSQKEAMDNIVIVLHMATRSQDTVKIDALPDYIKHLK